MSDHKGPWSPFEPPPPPRRRMSPVRVIVWLAVLAVFGGAIYLLARQFPGQDRQDWTRVAWLGLLLRRGLVADPDGRAPRLEPHGALRQRLGQRGGGDRAGLHLSHRAAQHRATPARRADPRPGPDRDRRQRRAVAGGHPDRGGLPDPGRGERPARALHRRHRGDRHRAEPADARRAGLDVANLDFSHTAETANGVGRGARAVASTLSVGGIVVRDMPVVVNQAPMTSSLLGMTFLSRLDSFEVRGGRLYLRPKR